MRFRIIRQLKKMLRDEEVRRTFTDFVGLRQELFQQQYDKVLCLDRYDLISDHIVVYEDSGFERPIAYIRSITSETCAEYDVPLPILQSISHSPVHLEAYKQFEARVPLRVNMSFLCLDQSRKGALGGIKIIDLLTWAALHIAGPRFDQMGYCSTPNSKFNQNAWLRMLGKEVEGIPQLQHPVVPDPHELVLIPKIREAYWAEQKLKFGSSFSDAEWWVPGKVDRAA